MPELAEVLLGLIGSISLLGTAAAVGAVLADGARYNLGLPETNKR